MSGHLEEDDDARGRGSSGSSGKTTLGLGLQQREAKITNLFQPVRTMTRSADNQATHTNPLRLCKQQIAAACNDTSVENKSAERQDAEGRVVNKSDLTEGREGSQTTKREKGEGQEGQLRTRLYLTFTCG